MVFEERLLPRMGCHFLLRCLESKKSHRLEHEMRRVSVLVAVLAAMALMSQAAFAVSVHWKHGSPTFTDNGLTLTERGTLAGLGGGDLLITLTATANPTATCTNPGNGTHQPPGQNPAPVTVTGSVSVPASAVKNGNASYVVTTNAPTYHSRNTR